MSNLTIGFYGMTHLGLIYSLACAQKGFSVIAYDPNALLINQLKQQTLPIEEPGFKEGLESYSAQINFTDHLATLLTAHLIFIAIDVPTNENNQSDLRCISSAVNHIKEKNTEVLLIILSQVPPGFMRSLSFNQENLFYQVETLIFGKALARALYPDRLIVGCRNEKAVLPAIYQTFLASFNCPLLIMRYESAELTKIAINLYLISSVSTTNFLANMARELNADWQEIIPALKLDQRIGEYAYLQPGLGISGGNLERDLMTIHHLAETHHVSKLLTETWLKESEYYKNWIIRYFQEQNIELNQKTNIAILGLSYKSNTHSIKNSPSITLINYLKNLVFLKIHDPIVKLSINHQNIQQFDTVAATLTKTDILILMTAWPSYQLLTPEILLTQMQGKIIIDPFRILNHSSFIQNGFSITTLGKKEAPCPI